MNASAASHLDALLEQCILALESNDQNAVEAVIAGHPDVAGQLRSRLEQLRALGLLDAPKPSTAIPERLGEFRLLRQIGRGGMGVVYIAEQATLGRQVALKLVHPEQVFFGDARARFRREVLAIARLQHPGIVPILTGGECEGIPFYAMELVHGASLAEVLRELAGNAPAALDGPALRAALERTMSKKGDATAIKAAPVFDGAWARVCSHLIADAADALQHAHEQGVLHRDVKPSNLLLTSDGRVRLIDFGLARAEGEHRITRSQATLGSLPYMAPEQVRADHGQIDARTDVYGLAVTLYELLTLTLPHGDGSGSTRERILVGHVQSPARRNTLVHPDVDAICLMAMDTDPRRRYPTVGEFGADLRAFLDRRSVRARRPSMILRARRWARRRPGRAAFAAVAFLTLVPGPLLFGLQQQVAAANLQRAVDEGNELRRLAEHNFEQALLAVDQMLFRTAAGGLAEHPRTTGLRRQLFEDAIAFHERLLAGTTNRVDSLRVRADRARSQVRLGRLHVELGDLPRAATTLAMGIDGLTAVLPIGNRPAVRKMELAAACHHLADVFGRMDRTPEALVQQRRALVLFREVIALEPGHANAVLAIGDARLQLVSLLNHADDFAEAHSVLDQLECDLAAPPPAGFDADQIAQWMIHRARVHDSRAVLATLQGETEVAVDSLQAGIACIDSLSDEQRRQPPAVAARLGMLERIGSIGLQRRDWQRAAEWLGAAATTLEELVVRDPDVPSLRARLADVLSSRASCRSHLQDVAGSEADHDRAIVLLDKVVQESPAVPDHQRQLAVAFGQRAGTRFMAGRPAEALTDLEAAELRFQQVLEQDPDDEVTKRNYAGLLCNHARTLGRLRRLAEARGVAGRALELAQQQLSGESLRSVIEIHQLVSELAMQDRDVETGRQAMQLASEAAAEWLAARPDDALRQSTLAMIELNRGTMHLQLRDHAEADRIWQAVLPTARAGAEGGPFGKEILAVLLLRLCQVAVHDHQVPAARQWFAAAIGETGITRERAAREPSLAALFDRPDLRDFVASGASR